MNFYNPEIHGEILPLTGKLPKPTISGFLVLGCCRIQNNTLITYVIYCSECSLDPELFGEAVFIIRRDHLLKGRCPCGCAPYRKWTKEQYKVLCARVQMDGVEFISLTEPFDSKNTKVVLRCEEHGNWETHTINNYLNMRKGCPKCSREQLTKFLLSMVMRTDEEIVDKFMSTQSFPFGTEFERLDKVDKKGKKPYWKVYCPVCETSNESKIATLSVGKRPCACSGRKPDKAYINLIMDDETPIAIKLGISSNPRHRVNTQNWRSPFKVINHSFWYFDDPSDCVAAEIACKEQLHCGILTQSEMPDGYTETTWVHNLDKVIEIYEINGGTRL